MKKPSNILVFLRLGKFPHPIYYDLLDYPPEGVTFLYEPISRGEIGKKPTLLHKLKVAVWKKYRDFRAPAAYIPPREAEIVHSTNNIMLRNHSPWVMDIEHVWGLVDFRPDRLKSAYFNQVLSYLSSPYCKHLMPYTEAAKQSLINAGGEKLRDKMTVVYPARHAVPSLVKKRNEKVRILWAGRRFYEKGGKTVLSAYEKLHGKAKFIFVIMGPVSDEIKKRYEGRDDIEFIENKTHDNRLWEEFRKADIFLYPTNLDSYGLALIDAMNHSLPIITTDTFAGPEIVENGKNGFLIKHPKKWHDDKFRLSCDSFYTYIDELKDFHDEKFVQEIADKTLILINNEKLRKELGAAGRHLVVSGKFSIKERNNKLRKIYEMAARTDR